MLRKISVMKIPTIFPQININTENSRTQLPSVNDGNDLTSSGAAPGGGGPPSLESEHHRTRDVDPDTAQPVQPKPGAEEQSARETIEAKEARKAGGNGEAQPSRN